MSPDGARCLPKRRVALAESPGLATSLHGAPSAGRRRSCLPVDGGGGGVGGVCVRESGCTLGKGVPLLCVYLPLVSARGGVPNRRSSHTWWRTLAEVTVELRLRAPSRWGREMSAQASGARSSVLGELQVRARLLPVPRGCRQQRHAGRPWRVVPAPARPPGSHCTCSLHLGTWRGGLHVFRAVGGG